MSFHQRKGRIGGTKVASAVPEKKTAEVPAEAPKPKAKKAKAKKKAD